MRWALLWILLIGLVLLPFLLFEEQFTAIASHSTRSGTSRGMVAVAVFGLLALDVFLPVPSSIVSTAAGVFLGFVAGTSLVWAGMMVGCLVGYAVGARGSGAARSLVGEDGIRRASAVASKYGDFTIVLCRPVPVLAEASVVFAGLVKAPFARFLRLTAVSNLGIALGYSAFGAFAQRQDSAAPFLLAFLGALLLPGVFMLISRYTFGRAAVRDS